MLSRQAAIDTLVKRGTALADARCRILGYVEKELARVDAEAAAIRQALEVLDDPVRLRTNEDLLAALETAGVTLVVRG